MSRLRLATVAVGMAAAVGMGGCGADSGGEADSSGPAGPEPGAASGEQAPPAAADPVDEGGGAADGGVAGGTLVDTRSIIYTGAITVRVADVATAARAATALTERAGGFVGADRRSAPEQADQARATLVLRIPADDFTETVNQLSELGDEESREIQTEDVTEEVVDVESRITSAQASIERTRALLERASSIQDIVRVEAELSEREAALGSLQARQRRLADLTALSTITANLLATDATAAPEEEPPAGFLAGLSAGWRAFTTSMTVLLTGLGVLLPWLVVFGGPAAAGVWWSRRRRALRMAPAGTPVPAAAAPTTGPAAGDPPPAA